MPWWAQTVHGTKTQLYIGEALYRAGDPAQPSPWQDPAELSRHLTLCHEHPEVLGNVYFSAKQVVADPIGAMARVVKDHYPPPRTPAALSRAATGAAMRCRWPCGGPPRSRGRET
ncbi:hypothetical protein GCM10020000_65410 [Streptomyces olivoverticillatus]